MARYGMLINTKKCVGCYACRVACQMVNGLESDEAFIKFDEMEQGVYPNVYAEVVPVQCMHCEDAPCEAVCPTHATYTTDSGVVLVDEERCIGCKYCMAACPYGARIQIKKTGVIEKCRFCWYEGEPGNPPRCVGTCISGRSPVWRPGRSAERDLPGNRSHQCPAAGGRPDHRENLLREVMINGLGIYDRLVPVFGRGASARAPSSLQPLWRRSIPTA